MAIRFKVVTILYITIFTFFIKGKLLSLEKTYRKGLEAYKGERWTECIKHFEDSVHLHKLYKSVLTNCRLKCYTEQYESHVPENIEYIKIYETFFNARNCIKQCQEPSFEELNMKNDVSEETLLNMQARKPFEYLHMCYFQMYNLPKAASATYTYLIENPSDVAMKENLQYYAAQPEVDVNEIFDLLSEDYAILYDLGIKAYKKNDWAETLASMTEAIKDYLSWENRCRVECDTQPAQEWSVEFTITISNHMASLLHCKQQCQDKLKPLGYSSGVEFLADVLNFIQISNYHLNDLNEASKAVATYLMLYPDDEDMIQNKQIYSTKVPKEEFAENMDIMYYFKRDKYEKLLLDLYERSIPNSKLV